VRAAFTQLSAPAADNEVTERLRGVAAVTDILTPQKAPVSGLLAGIYREIMTDRAHLPSMPDVAIRIRASMQKPNYTAATVARVVKADPGMSAYLLRAANSALYRGVVPIQNVENAVARLGMDATRNLVTAYAMRAMFKTRSRVLSRLMQDTWRQSARRAALASVIATRCPGFDPDRAMLGGLLQDIGVLPLLYALEGRKDLLLYARDAVSERKGWHGKTLGRNHLLQRRGDLGEMPVRCQVGG